MWAVPYHIYMFYYISLTIDPPDQSLLINAKRTSFTLLKKTSENAGTEDE